MVRVIIAGLVFLTACSAQQEPPTKVQGVCTQLDSGSILNEINLDGISDQELLSGVILYCPDYTTEVEAFLNDRN